MKYYIQYPISLDCQLSCSYCFLNYDRKTYGLREPKFKIDDYIKWRDTHLKDAEDIVIHFAGGEPFTNINTSKIVEFIKNTDNENIDLLSNGLSPLNNYEKLISFHNRIKRIGFTYHRKLIDDNYELKTKFIHNVLFMHNCGFKVYVKELLFEEDITSILENKAKWISVGIDFKIQDFKGYNGGSDFTELKQYSNETRLLIDDEYLKNPFECQCSKGYKNIIIRGGWSDGDILACWKDPVVIGNIIDNTYDPNYLVINTDNGMDVKGPEKIYRGEHKKDQYYLGIDNYTIYDDKKNIVLLNEVVLDDRVYNSFYKIINFNNDNELTKLIINLLNIIESKKTEILVYKKYLSTKYISENEYIDELNIFLKSTFEIPIKDKIKLSEGIIQSDDILVQIGICELN